MFKHKIIFILGSLNIITFITTIISFIFFVVFIFPHLYLIFKFIVSLIFCITIISQIYVSLINPGISSKTHFITDTVIESFINQAKLEIPKNNKLRICRLCNIFAENKHNVKHCDVCNICTYGKIIIFILDMQLHCKLLGKCIARNNDLVFNIFIFSLLTYIILVLVCLICYLSVYLFKM